MTNIPILKTQRTHITILHPDEADYIFQYYKENQNHLQSWEPERDDNFYLLEEWKNRIERTYTEFLEKKSAHFVALNPEKTKMIAGCNFSNIVYGVFQACYLGCSISKKYEGQGIMYEVASECIAYMFQNMKLHRIMANYMPCNKRSEKLLEKLGFEKEGYAKKYLKIAGKWEDHVLTALVYE